MVIKSYRSILALVLAMVTTFLVSCSSPQVAKPPTYSAQQLEQIQRTASTLADLRDKMPTLQDKIFKKNWTDVGTYIHGPLGELRQKVSYLTRQLLPKDQKAVKEVAKDLFDSFEKLDVAATKGNYPVAVENYREALKDLDQFLQAVPKQS
ncbi:MAG: photosystem II protein PsbQ [Potamolinea sp.]